MRNREAGFLWIEMVVVVAIMGITAAAVIPIIGTVLSDSKARGAAEQVVGALRLARQNSISTAATYQVTFTGSTIQISCLNNCPANRPPDTTEPVATGATLVWTANPIGFTPTGTATQAGIVTVSYADATNRQISVNLPGMVRLCPSTCS